MKRADQANEKQRVQIGEIEKEYGRKVYALFGHDNCDDADIAVVDFVHEPGEAPSAIIRSWQRPERGTREMFEQWERCGFIGEETSWERLR